MRIVGVGSTNYKRDEKMEPNIFSVVIFSFLPAIIALLRKVPMGHPIYVVNLIAGGMNIAGTVYMGDNPFGMLGFAMRNPGEFYTILFAITIVWIVCLVWSFRAGQEKKKDAGNIMDPLKRLNNKILNHNPKFYWYVGGGIGLAVAMTHLPNINMLYPFWEYGLFTFLTFFFVIAGLVLGFVKPQKLKNILLPAKMVFALVVAAWAGYIVVDDRARAGLISSFKQENRWFLERCMNGVVGLREDLVLDYGLANTCRCITNLVKYVKNDEGHISVDGKDIDDAGYRCYEELYYNGRRGRNVLYAEDYVRKTIVAGCYKDIKNTGVCRCTAIKAIESLKKVDAPFPELARKSFAELMGGGEKASISLAHGVCTGSIIQNADGTYKAK